MRDKKVIRIYIDRGSKDGKRIVLRGEGDAIPNGDPGDVVIILDVAQHERFNRIGNNLYYKMNITLSEALTGVKRQIKTLDNRMLLVATRPAEIIEPGSFKMIYEEGMPNIRNPMDKGLMIIQFEVEFPKNNSLNSKQIEQLKCLLPAPTDIKISDSCEEVELRPCDPEFVQRQNQSHQDDDDDDDDSGPHHRHGAGGPHVQQCTTG